MFASQIKVGLHFSTVLAHHDMKRNRFDFEKSF